MWTQIIIAIATVVLSVLLAPRPPGQKNATRGALDIPHPPIGEPIPVVFGTVWHKQPGVIYYGNPRTKDIESEGGGKK